MDAARADLSRTWALVPIRGLETAKTRLGGDLDAEERLELVTELLRRTLVATRDSRRIDGTVVVTMDGAAAELAQAHGALGLVERAPGLNEAISAARSLAVARGATAVLVLPADLPAVSAGAIDNLVERAAEAGAGRPAADAGIGGAVADGVVVAAAGAGAAASPDGRAGGLVALVPDRHGAGTNALLLSPPDVAEPAFGPDSRLAHQQAAEGSGAMFAELDSPLSIDVDTSADLAAAEAILGSIRA